MNFNSLSLVRNTLNSEVVRTLIGDRVIDLIETVESDTNGNFITRVFSFGKKLVGFVVGLILTSFTWTLSSIWDFLVEAYFEVKYFDWNQTDSAIKKQLEANNIAIFGALGRLTGTGLVWLTSIGISAGLTYKFPVIAGRVALALAEEGGQEIRSALTNLILVSRNIAIQNFLMTGLLTIRRLKIFGQEPILTEKKPWTFAEAIDEKIQQLSDAKIQAFLNSFGDSVEDAIIEAGYVVAFTLDDHFASQSRANQDAFGTNRVVEITPNTDVEEERIIIDAPQELIIPTVQSTVSNHQLIYNRDVGQIAGIPEQDYLTPRPQRRKLKVIFKSKEKPPWRLDNGSIAKTVESSIPDVKRGLTWEKLKRNIKKYTWGEFRVTAILNTGRQMTVYGASSSEAETQLKALAALSDSTIIRITGGRDIQNDPRRKKLPTLVYPAYAKLILGNIDAQGNVISNNNQTIRIDLWTDTEPENLANIS